MNTAAGWGALAWRQAEGCPLQAPRPARSSTRLGCERQAGARAAAPLHPPGRTGEEPQVASAEPGTPTLHSFPPGPGSVLCFPRPGLASPHPLSWAASHQVLPSQPLVPPCGSSPILICLLDLSSLTCPGRSPFSWCLTEARARVLEPALAMCSWLETPPGSPQAPDSQDAPRHAHSHSVVCADRQGPSHPTSPAPSLARFFFFFKYFIYLFMSVRHTERGRDTGRERIRLPAGGPLQDSILGPGDHALSEGRHS